jgi:hypothetical protein
VFALSATSHKEVKQLFDLVRRDIKDACKVRLEASMAYLNLKGIKPYTDPFEAQRRLQPPEIIIIAPSQDNLQPEESTKSKNISSHFSISSLGPEGYFSMYVPVGSSQSISVRSEDYPPSLEGPKDSEGADLAL